MQPAAIRCCLLLIALPAISCWAQGAGQPAANNKSLLLPLEPSITITDAERRWLATHPVVRMGVTVDMEPWVISHADGGFSGILPDLFAEFEQRLGLRFELVVDKWPEVLARAKRGDIDSTTASVRALKANNMLPSSVYFEEKIAAFSRSDQRLKIESLEQLEGQTIVYYGASHGELLTAISDRNRIYRVNNAREAFQKLLSHEADVFLGNSFDNYYVVLDQLIGVRPFYVDLEYGFPVAMGVRPDWQPLAGLYNKALIDIGEARINDIMAKWVSLTAESEGLHLSATQRGWLAALAPITVLVLEDFPPFEFRDEQGNWAGISSDYAKILSARLGIKLQPKFISINTEESIEQLLAQGTMLLFSPRNLDGALSRQQTRHYLQVPNILLTPRDAATIQSINDVAGRRIGVIRRSPGREFLATQQLDLDIHQYTSIEDGLRDVLNGKLYAFYVNSVAADYIQKQRAIEGLKVALATGQIYRPVITVDASLQPLIPMLDSLLSDFIPQEKRLIFDRWANPPQAEKIDWLMLIRWGAVSLILLTALFSSIIFWNRRLQQAYTMAEQAREAAENSRELADEANRAKSIFLANMSHEIRTPMNAILGFSELMKNDSDTSADHQEWLDIISSAGNHLLSLINDVLDISKIEAGKITLTPETVDIRRMLKELERIFSDRCREKSLGLIFNGGESLPRAITADEAKLRQILINLLGNAVKFTEHGYIICESSARELQAGKYQLSIDVIDTGPGIAPEEVDKVFSSFEQTASGLTGGGGTGLGLAISREFARLMAGDISFSSRVADNTTVNTTNCSGTRFHFQFVTETAVLTADALRAEEIIGLSTDRQGTRILIVDDKLDNRLLIIKQLEPLGFRLCEAENGLQAIEQFERFRPHLVLMDMHMPKLGGIAAIQKIRTMKDGSSTPIIAQTASAFEEDRESILSQGADGFLRKPIQRDVLLTQLAEQLQLSWRYQDRSASSDIEMAVNKGNKSLSLTASHRLLVIDDVKVNRLLLMRILTAEGYECREATNGSEALSLLQHWPAQLILLDIQMPVMDGYEFLRRWPPQSAGAAVPVLAVTADNSAEEALKLKALGAAAICEKPLQTVQLKKTIKRLLNSELIS